jgi:hypothetical protein
MHPRSGCGNIRHLIFLGLLLVILACTAAHAPQPLGDDAQPPGINIVARQALFDYSTRQVSAKPVDLLHPAGVLLC